MVLVQNPNAIENEMIITSFYRSKLILPIYSPPPTELRGRMETVRDVGGLWCSGGVAGMHENVKCPCSRLILTIH